MNGLDRGKATDGPMNDGLGVAEHDSPWGGPEAAPAARETDPVSAGDAAGDETPATDVPGEAKPAKAVPRPANPWHHSRPKRTVRRPARPGATATGSVAALGLARATMRRLAHISLPQLNPHVGRAWAPWLGGALVLAWLGTTALHPVGPHEQAIIATFGASGPTLGPGLAASWPWPIGSAHVEDVTTVRHLALADNDSEQLMLTRDGSLVDVGFDVRWRIRDLRRHDLWLADPDVLLRLNANAAMRATVADMDFRGVIGAGRDVLAHEAARRLQALLDRDQAGIAIDGIDLRRADPPAHVADALRAVAAARNDAATEATQAQSWSRQLVVHAQGEAGAFDKVYAQYRLSPEITHRQMYYATMERVLSQSDKVIVDAPGTPTTLPPLTVPAPDAPAGATRPGNGR
jgi:membrane protease subunit HflK